MNKKFKHIVDEYNGIFYKIGRSYTTNKPDFEDLYQEMLIQLWNSMRKFKGDSKISTWIYRVALNTALTYKRDKTRKPISSSIENIQFKLASDEVEGIEKMQKKEAKITLLYTCINLLKKDDRAIILLHLEEKKYAEIAEIIGLTTSHVGVKIKRIKEQLYRLLKERNYGRI